MSYIANEGALSETNTYHGGPEERYLKIRAAFVARGTSLNAWCSANGHHLPNVRAAIFGEWVGPKASELIAKVEDAAGVSPS